MSNSHPNFSFPRYLSAKKTVDDRALNKDVWQRFLNEMTKTAAKGDLHIIEAGCGIGAMLERLLPELLRIANSPGREGTLTLNYLGVDEASENIHIARERTSAQLKYLGFFSKFHVNTLHFSAPAISGTIEFETGDIYKVSASPNYLHHFDVLIAHAFLDLFDLPEILARLFRTLKSRGLYYFPINFDGVTIFQPENEMDAQILLAYHRSMDDRVTNGKRSGDSRAGRHLFQHLPNTGAEIFAAGASDWVVFPQQNRYPADEAYFLHHILYFFETSLKLAHFPDPEAFQDWIDTRRTQIERGELAFIAHQMDFVGRVG